MSKQLQLRRGTTIQNEAFTGAVGELTLDTDTGEIRVHDGVTQGGAEFIDAVVAFQKPTAENGYTWYRKYASGWVEQGGILLAATAQTVTITLPVEMANTNYIWSVGFSYNNSGTMQYHQMSIWDKTTTTFKMAQGASADKCWEVKGMAA